MTENFKKTLIFAIGITLITIPPLLFTGNLFITSQFDFSDTGQIGDTIGGLTAPFVGVFGAILVYISFLKQVEANNILKDEIDRSNFFATYNEITQLLDLTNSQFDNIRYKDTKGGISTKGEEAFDTWLNSTEEKDLNELSNKIFLKECFYVLELVDKTSKSIEAFYDANDIQVGILENKKTKKKAEISNSTFNFKNLLRLKFLHFYQLKYNATIIRLKNFKEAKEIEDIFDDVAKYEAFTTNKSKLNINTSPYLQFQKILTAIGNIEITLNKKNTKFWGEKPIKK